MKVRACGYLNKYPQTCPSTLLICHSLVAREGRVLKVPLKRFSFVHYGDLVKGKAACLANQLQVHPETRVQPKHVPNTTGLPLFGFCFFRYIPGLPCWRATRFIRTSWLTPGPCLLSPKFRLQTFVCMGSDAGFGLRYGMDLLLSWAALHSTFTSAALLHC